MTRVWSSDIPRQQSTSFIQPFPFTVLFKDETPRSPPPQQLSPLIHPIPQVLLQTKGRVLLFKYPSGSFGGFGGMASPFTGSAVDVDPSHQHISPPETGNRIQKRPAPRGTAAYPRKRANKACQVCRARRTKCDNKRPSCTFCEKAGTECVWAPHDLSS